jgi:hypothetical protein
MREERLDMHFEAFTKALRVATARYDHLKKRELAELQHRQVDQLSALELEWRKEIVNSEYCELTYKYFVKYICDDLHNIRAARPFFRERQIGFSAKVSKPLRRRNWRALLRLHPNYNFITLVMGARRWSKKSKPVKLLQQITALRNELVLVNMPLAISRTKIFWRKTPHSHMSFMDLLGEAASGFLSAVDKFQGPYTKKWRSVAIGRAHGNFIESYSSTLLHFFPLDKQRLYRANKAMSGRVGKPQKGQPRRRLPALHGPTVDDVMNVVNERMKKRFHATTEDVESIMAASSTVSGDSLPAAAGDEPGATILDRQEADDGTRPDVRAENDEAARKMLAAANTLSLVERKILKMRGLPVQV